MTHEETRELLDVLGDLFDKWKPTPSQLAIWERAFGRHSDYAKTKEALEELFATATYSTPNMKQFNIIINRNSDTQERPDGPVDTKFYVQCTVPPEGKPGMAGWYAPVVFSSKNPPSQEYWRELGGQHRQNHENLYGGEWQLVDCSTIIDGENYMRTRRKELRDHYDKQKGYGNVQQSA